MGLKIEKIKGEYPVYDIKVKDNENFYANDILVHNCIEIMQSTNETTTAICTLSSMILKNFFKGKKFDFDLLYNEVRKVVKALNKVIDINSYSTSKGKKGGFEQRAIAIGVQGFADLVYMMDLIFTGKEARLLNKQIAETIYYAAVTESMELCKSGEYKSYDYFEGSPMQKGIFQFDMWGLTEVDLSGMWDWNSLKAAVAQYGICNSLFVAYMPTASSAKISGSYESFEPMDSNLFNRRVVGGEFLIVNKYLISDLEEFNMWNEQIKNEIIINNGSIQNINFQKYIDVESKNYEKKIKRIEHLISKYKTVWEIPQKELIEMSAERSPFIDQSQSLNIYMANPTVGKISSSIMFAWKKGLKTGSYYLRTKAISTGAKHLAIDVSNKSLNSISDEEIDLKNKIDEENAKNIKSNNSEFDCFGCSS